MSNATKTTIRWLHYPIEVIDPCDHYHLPPEIDSAVTGLDWGEEEWSCKPSRVVCAQCCVWPENARPHDACAQAHVWDLVRCWPCPTLLAIGETDEG